MVIDLSKSHKTAYFEILSSNFGGLIKFYDQGYIKFWWSSIGSHIKLFKIRFVSRGIKAYWVNN